jgi:hypothetical protein
VRGVDPFQSRRTTLTPDLRPDANGIIKGSPRLRHGVMYAKPELLRMLFGDATAAQIGEQQLEQRP